jgi:hypothetical protein
MTSDGVAELALRHLGQVDALRDDGASRYADDRLGGLDSGLHECLTDRLLNRVRLLHLAALDRARGHVGDAEPPQLVARSLRLELDHLDRARTDVQADYFGSLLLLPETPKLFFCVLHRTVYRSL